MATESENEDDLWRTTFVHFMKVTDDCEQAKQAAAYALGAYRDRHTPPSPPDTSCVTPAFRVKDGAATFTVDAAAISTNAETFTFSPGPPSVTSPNDPTFSSEQKIVGEEGGSLGILTASYHPGHVFVTVIDEDAQESIVIVSLAGLRALVGHEPATDQPEPAEPQLDDTPEPIEVSCLLAATGSQLDERGKKLKCARRLGSTLLTGLGGPEPDDDYRERLIAVARYALADEAPEETPLQVLSAAAIEFDSRPDVSGRVRAEIVVAAKGFDFWLVPVAPSAGHLLLTIRGDRFPVSLLGRGKLCDNADELTLALRQRFASTHTREIVEGLLAAPAIFSVQQAIAETDLPSDISSAAAVRELWARLGRTRNAEDELRRRLSTPQRVPANEHLAQLALKAAAYDEITEALGFVDETPTTSEVVALARKASDALTDAANAANEPAGIRTGWSQICAAAGMLESCTAAHVVERINGLVSTELGFAQAVQDVQAAAASDKDAETERKREQVHELISTATGTTLDSFGRWLAFFRYGGLSELGHGAESDSDYREQLLAHLPSVSLECVDRLLSKYTIGDATHEQTSEEPTPTDGRDLPSDPFPIVVVWARTARVSHTGGVAPWTFGSRVCKDNDNLVACLALLSREGFAYGDQDEVKIFRLAQSDRDIEGEYGIITLTHDSEGRADGGRVDGVLSGDEWTELDAQVSARSAEDTADS